MMTPCLCTGRADIVCTGTECSIAGPGEPGNPNNCRVCWLRLGRKFGRLSLPCRHLGPRTGEARRCASCNQTLREVPVYACAKHGTCTLDRSFGDIPSCHVCDDRAPAPRRAIWDGARFVDGPLPEVALVVNHGAGGIGDAVLGMYAIAGLKAQNPSRPIAFAVHERAAPFAALFEGGFDLIIQHDWDDCKDVPPGAHEGDSQINVGYGLECRTRAARPRWQRYADNLGGVDLVAPRLRDPGRLEALGRDHLGCVVLAPFSTWTNREWRVEAWLTLERLLIESGFRVVILGDDPERCATFRSEKIVRAPAERAAAVVYNAACVVGNDSGVAHLAGAMGVPTVVLCGQTTGASVFGLYARSRWLQGNLDCGGCWWQAPYHAPRCDPTCAALASITPREVLHAVLAQIGVSGRAVLDGARMSVLSALTRRCDHLEGDLAELGVYRGGSALAMATASPGRPLHLFDTFSGLPADDIEGKHRKGDFAGDLGEVRQLLHGHATRYHVGTFPETAAALDDLRFALVHLDADLYQSTRDALRWFWPRLVPGGVMVMDDVDWRDCPGVRKALDEVLPGVPVLIAAPCQGVVVKPAV